MIQRAVHIHPTVAELVPTLLGSLEPLGEAHYGGNDGMRRTA